VPAQSIGCSAQQETQLRDRLRNAFRTGLNCMEYYKATEIGMELAFNLAVRDVEFNCAYISTVNTAHLDPASYLDPTRPIRIDIDWGDFSQLSDYEQASALFHELMHALFGGHNAKFFTYSRYEEIDRVVACENLCFGPAEVSKCSCATCLGTTDCDQRCHVLPDCDPQMGFVCPCPAGPNAGKIFSRCSTCLSTCPSGLACFGYSTCHPIYRGCGSPPTCP